jgi:hypothetical protein
MRDWIDYLWPIPLSFLASFLLILILGREVKALDDHRVESAPEYISEADAKRALSHAVFFVVIGVVISLFVNENSNLTAYLILAIFITSVVFSVIFSARERMVNDGLSTISHEVKELKSSRADIDKMRQALSDHEKLMREILKDLQDFKKTTVDLSSSSIAERELLKYLSDDIDSLRDDSSELQERFIKLQEGIYKQLEGKEIFRSMSYWEINERVKDMIVLLQDQDKYIRSVVTGPHRDLFIDANLEQNVMPALSRIEDTLRRNLKKDSE